MPAAKDNNVVPLLTRQMAENLLRQAGEDTSKLINTIRYRPKEVWFEVVSYRQIILCLTEGEIVDGPTRDEHGNFVCTAHRTGAGLDVFVTFAIEPQGENRVYVLRKEEVLK
ncbi:MAG: hypothetical protein OXH52_22705 [Gammaproteobacteria bacterium]|nr:hypothetical protein [Gammaproteobacteria bacterium]